MRKRILGILVATTMVLGLVGCGSSVENEVSGQVEKESMEVEEQATNEVETESTESTEVETTEQAEKIADGFQYQVTFDVNGTQKVIGFNTPEGYELESRNNRYYNFINAKNDSFSISPFTVEEFGEEAIKSYENYLSTGEWKGLYGEFIQEEFLSERIVEVPGGTAKIITVVSNDTYKSQNIFIDFDGCIINMNMNLRMDFMLMDEEVKSGTEEEFIVDEILAQLFVESDNTEYLYPISESTVEMVEGTYEYDLSYYNRESEKVVAFFGFNLPEGDFAQSEEDIALAEEFAEYGNSYFNFTDSKGKEIIVSQTDGMGNPYESVCVYRHFLRTGEMTEGVENTFFGEGGVMDMHIGNLVDMQLGENVDTPYGSAYIVKGLWQYDTFTQVSEIAMLNVNGKEVIITLHNRNAEPGVTLDSYESQLKNMIAEMF